MRALVCVALCSCGRVDFDPLADAAASRFATPRVLLYGSDLGATATRWRAALDAFTVDIKETIDSTPMTTALLADRDIVVIRDLAQTHVVEEASSLANWIIAGGSLMVLSGYVPGTGDLPFYNALLADVPVQLALPQLNGDVVDYVTSPVTVGLVDLPYMGGYTLVGNLSAGAAVVVALLQNDPVAATAPFGTGRIYAFGDEWVTFDMSWTAQPSCETFWTNAWAYLRHQI